MRFAGGVTKERSFDLHEAGVLFSLLNFSSVSGLWGFIADVSEPEILIDGSSLSSFDIILDAVFSCDLHKAPPPIDSASLTSNLADRLLRFEDSFDSRMVEIMVDFRFLEYCDECRLSISEGVSEYLLSGSSFGVESWVQTSARRFFSTEQVSTLFTGSCDKVSAQFGEMALPYSGIAEVFSSSCASMAWQGSAKRDPASFIGVLMSPSHFLKIEVLELTVNSLHSFIHVMRALFMFSIWRIPSLSSSSFPEIESFSLLASSSLPRMPLALRRCFVKSVFASQVLSRTSFSSSEAFCSILMSNSFIA